MALRIIFSTILLISILFMPFWLSLILGLAGMILFPMFWEAIALFLLSDFLFGVKEARFFNMFFIASITSLIILFALEALKKKLKFYPK